MGKSLWSVATLGLCGLLAMAVLAVMGLPGLQQATQSKVQWIRMGDAIRETFQVPQAHVSLEGPREETVRVSYRTSRYLSFSKLETDEELKKVGAFAISQLPTVEQDPVRGRIQKVRVIREEVRGGGCSESRHTAEMVLDAPPPAPRPRRIR